MLSVVLVVVMAFSVTSAFAIDFSGNTINEVSWKTFVSASPTLPTFGVHLTAASKPVVGQCFMSDDNWTWGSALYTYPKNGNSGYSYRSYTSNVNGSIGINWRMRTNNDVSGAAHVEGDFKP